jgi:aspartate aminotransferase
MGNSNFKNEWVKELKEVTGRIVSVRTLLLNKLKELKTPGYWQHIVNQRGLFTNIGLDGKEEILKIFSFSM